MKMMKYDILYKLSFRFFPDNFILCFYMEAT